MTEEQIREIMRLKTNCVDAGLKVERATVEAHQANWKLQAYLYEMMRQETGK